MLLGLASTYPVKGLWFFLRPENRGILWRRVAGFATEVTASSVAIVGSVFGLTFKAQRNVMLSVVPHVFGTPSTVALILIESAIPVVLLFNHRLHRVQEKLFVDVMHLQGTKVLTAGHLERTWIANQQSIQLRHDMGHKSRTKSAFAMLTEPDVTNKHPVAKYLFTLPINLIPVVGQVLFCYVNAMQAGITLHHFYYKKLKGLSPEDEATMVRYRETEYKQFGLVASALTLLPGVNVLLVLTNSIGAALWAAEIERDMQPKWRSATPLES